MHIARCLGFRFVLVTTLSSAALIFLPGFECRQEEYPYWDTERENTDDRGFYSMTFTPATVIIEKDGRGAVTVDFVTSDPNFPPPDTHFDCWVRVAEGSLHVFSPDPSHLNFAPGHFRTFFEIDTQAFIPEATPGIYHAQFQAGTSQSDAKHNTHIQTTYDERTLTILIVPSNQQAAPPVTQVAAGDYHNLAVLADGSVWGWGLNDHGQVGDGTQISRVAPVPVRGLPGPAAAVAAGGRHSLALLQDGTVWGWGDNSRLQLWPEGDSPNQPSRLAPTQAFCFAERYGGQPNGGPLTDVVAIAAGGAHSMALTADGVVMICGDNEAGQAGRGPDYHGIPSKGTEVSIPVPITAIAAGRDFSLALDAENQVWGWGQNNRGQQGNRVDDQYTSPHILAHFSGVQAIAAGAEHMLALMLDGTVRTAGDNTRRQLGVEDPGNELAVTVAGLGPITAVDAGFFHSLALGADGVIYAWGDNRFGQLGMMPDPSLVASAIPWPIETAYAVQALAAGGRHSLAMPLACPSLLSWADNSAGQLGDGTLRSSAALVQVDRLGEASDPGPCEFPLSVIVAGQGQVHSLLNGIPWGDIQCGSACARSFTPGTELELVAEPNEGWIFSHWSGDAQGVEATTKVQFDASRNIIANFSRTLSPPTAQFTFTPRTPLTTDRVVFDASGSLDNGRIILYQWDFDNDGHFDAVLNNARAGAAFTAAFVKQFWIAGTRVVQLRVTDEDGLTDETAHEITVGQAEQPAHDLGDAPDSSNSLPGVTVLAYPNTATVARFPTVYQTETPPYGPRHWSPQRVFLGHQVTLENEADVGVDEDPTNNIDLGPQGGADQDGGDDGVSLPLALPYGNKVTLDYTVTVASPPGDYLYVNVWFDWNRDGDWDDTLTYPDGREAPEWAVRNEGLSMFLAEGSHTLTTGAFMCWHPSPANVSDPLWMRITLSDLSWGPMDDPQMSAYGGAGPEKGYRLGETEDYLIYPH